MLSLPPITLRLRSWKLIDRVALAFLLLCSIVLGAACGLLFVYASDLPEIRALETYRPTVVTEIYADDGQLVGSFALHRSFRRKMQEMLLALQIERRYTKPQIFTMYANQVYLAHGNYGFAAAAQFYFGEPVTDLKVQEAALLAGMVNGPKFSPLSNP